MTIKLKNWRYAFGMNDNFSEVEIRAIQDILIEALDIHRDQLILDARIEDDLGADSLDMVQITMAIEERFELAIPEQTAAELKTVGDLFSVLGELLENKQR